jgi:type I restriction enzyme S subunit
MDEKLPEGWVETTLGDILPIKYGKGLSEVIRDKNGKVPVYGSSGIVGYHDQALTSDETLILGRKGTVGSVYYSSVPCWPIDTTYFVERTASINLKFFLHLLSSLQLIRLDKSTAIPGLSRDDYNDIPVRIPPSCEQNRIVAAIEQQFTRLDNAVASLQSAKRRVKQYRVSLLKAAVEGELTKEWRAEHPTNETGAQLLARILAERRARWEEEQLRKMREKGITPKDNKWKLDYKEPQGPDVENLPTLPGGGAGRQWIRLSFTCEMAFRISPKRILLGILFSV